MRYYLFIGVLAANLITAYGISAHKVNMNNPAQATKIIMTNYDSFEKVITFKGPYSLISYPLKLKVVSRYQADIQT